MTVAQQVIAILRTTLGLGQLPLTPESPLLGSLPQLDSMAVVGLLTALEEHFGIVIDDDDLHARHFATVATLTAVVAAKLS
ncbi:MAG: acyl carrier protein [Duganella sp.]